MGVKWNIVILFLFSYGWSTAQNLDFEARRLALSVVREYQMLLSVDAPASEVKALFDSRVKVPNTIVASNHLECYLSIDSFFYWLESYRYESQKFGVYDFHRENYQPVEIQISKRGRGGDYEVSVKCLASLKLITDQFEYELKLKYDFEVLVSFNQENSGSAKIKDVKREDASDKILFVKSAYDLSDTLFDPVAELGDGQRLYLIKLKNGLSELRLQPPSRDFHLYRQALLPSHLLDYFSQREAGYLDLIFKPHQKQWIVGLGYVAWADRQELESKGILKNQNTLSTHLLRGFRLTGDRLAKKTLWFNAGLFYRYSSQEAVFREINYLGGDYKDPYGNSFRLNILAEDLNHVLSVQQSGIICDFAYRHSLWSNWKLSLSLGFETPIWFNMKSMTQEDPRFEARYEGFNEGDDDFNLDEENLPILKDFHSIESTAHHWLFGTIIQPHIRLGLFNNLNNVSAWDVSITYSLGRPSEVPLVHRVSKGDGAWLESGFSKYSMSSFIRFDLSFFIF